VRHPDFSPSRLPPEWLNAIREAQEEKTPEHVAADKPHGRERINHLESYEHVSELRALISRLKRERIGKGLSLGAVSRLTQQARSALSRLESGEYSNPTLNTLYRYARALGWHIRFSAEPIDEATTPEGTRPGSRKA
jgi:hypothetical protein